jgi:hypothetical protein
MNTATETRTDAKQIAQTTLAQLGGTNRLAAMISAKHFAFDTDGSIQFKFSGSRKWNSVKISLNQSTDTYTVEFHKVTMGANYNVKRAPAISMVYADSLRKVFESETSLYLSI